MNILGKNEHFIKLSQEHGAYEIYIKAGAPNAIWTVDVDAHPKPILTWYNNRNQVINDGPKYKTMVVKNRVSLEIISVSIRDRGRYTLKAHTKFEEKNLTLFLNVTGK